MAYSSRVSSSENDGSLYVRRRTRKACRWSPSQPYRAWITRSNVARFAVAGISTVRQPRKAEQRAPYPAKLGTKRRPPAARDHLCLLDPKPSPAALHQDRRGEPRARLPDALDLTRAHRSRAAAEGGGSGPASRAPRRRA